MIKAVLKAAHGFAFIAGCNFDVYIDFLRVHLPVQEQMCGGLYHMR